MAGCDRPDLAGPKPIVMQAQIDAAPAPAVAPVANEAARARATTIVMLGDSLTAGFGLSAQEALPEQVDKRLSAAGIEVNMVNAGVSGDTTANGLARFDWSVGSAQPDTVILALGANDYLMGLSADIAQANLSAIIERAQGEGIAVILAGLKPRGSAVAGSRDAAYAAIYPALAETYGLPLYPDLMAGVSDQPDLLQGDGLHPTAAGIDTIADAMTDFLIGQLVPATP